MTWADMTNRLQGVAMRAFGTPTKCAYEPEGLATVNVDAIFRRDAELVDAATGASVATEGPVLDVRISDLGQDPRGKVDRVTVPAIPGVHPTQTRYLVQRVAKDGEGAATLFLHEKATG